MQTVQLRPGVTRDVQIMLTSDDHPEMEPMQNVDRMFDVNGSETFDPTEAVEIDSDGTLRQLRSGDRLTVIVQF